MPYNYLEDLAWLGNQLKGGHDSYRSEYQKTFQVVFPREEDRVRANQLLYHSMVIGPAQLEWNEAVKQSFIQEESLLEILGSPEAVNNLMGRISRLLKQKFEPPFATRGKQFAEK